MVKRVAIIGAGESGLACIKSCKEEGVEPVCFERTYDLGGLWRYEEENYKHGTTVYKSTFINTSKEMMCFSDFPFPKEWPNYLHNTKLQKYFNMYADAFDLRRHIRFNTEVVTCRLAKDFDQTGNWLVTTKCQKNGEENTELFGGVLVCIGHHETPHFPLDSFPGVKKFKGEVSHSHDYKHQKGFEGKNVLVIGIGNSGGDIAVELSWHAKQVYLSTRSGNWVMNRVSTNGMPLDIYNLTRFNSFMMNLLPFSFVNDVMEAKVNERFNHANYGLKPKHRIFQQHAMFNDDLPNRILNGSVKVKTNVKSFDSDTAMFIDGTKEKIDAVIFATGYIAKFPFIEDSILKVENMECDLYKYMWPLTVKQNTLAIIGHLQPLGAVNPTSEIQTRWAARVIKGINKLPSVKQMKKDVDFKREAMAKKFYNSPRHTLEIPFVAFMDEISGEFGAKPNIWKLWLTDPRLAYHISFEPCSPYQYRLVGPHKCKDARKLILTQMDRVLYPLKSRATPPDVKKGFGFWTYLMVLAIAYTLYCYMV